MMESVFIVAKYVGLVVIFAGLVQYTNYFIQLLLAAFQLAKSGRAAKVDALWRRYSDSAPPIAILVPAYNEEKTIVESLSSLMAIQYPNYEVIIINDGSSDATLEVLKDAFNLVETSRLYSPLAPHQPIKTIYRSQHQKRLVVIDKANGGKADALNAGINVSRAPLFCCVDADSVLEPDALLRTVKPFMEDPERTIAVGGTVRIANGSVIRNGQILKVQLPKKMLPLLQTVEYLRAFLMTRIAWSRLNTVLIISGAFGLFRRDAVLKVGGYSLGTVGEDMELVVKLHRTLIEQKQDYRIRFIPEPVCWTEAPETLSVLRNQRARWQRGTLETFERHGMMALNPRYGLVGVLGFGNVLITDVIGPVVDAIGFILFPILAFTGSLPLDYFLAYIAVTSGFGLAISVGSLALEEAQLRRVPKASDLALLTAIGVLENLGYRQLNSLWRVQGWVQYLKRSGSWGVMTRKGFTAS